MKVYKIYFITNDINSKKYVGVTTTSLKARIASHVSMKTLLGVDIRKFGKEHFSMKIIKRFRSKESALQEESNLIWELDTHEPNGYNRQVRGGKYKGRGGGKKNNKNARRTGVIQLTKIGKEVRRFDSTKGASEITGIHRGNIRRSFKSETLLAGGYKWKLINNILEN